MQSEELISIDKLEDQIIDHPDASTKKDLNESLDETFQKKLNARAQQIKSTNNNSYNNTSTRQQSKGQHRNSNQDSSSSSSSTSSGGINYQFLITKSHLNYTYTDYNSLEQEICEWFSINDFKSLGGLNNLILNYTNDLNNNNNKASITELIQNLHANHKIDDLSTNTLQTILYYSFGEYGDKKSKSDQLDSIKRNNLQLINDKLYQPLINIIQNFFNDRISHDKATTNHPESSTLSIRQQEPIYFIILTLISEFKKYLKETDFLTSLLTFIEHWKWHPNNCYRIRYLILMVNKLIFLELGDSNHMKQCDEFLVKLHHVKNKPTKESSESNLTCSPLDYFVFRQDLIDKYPLYDETELKPYDFRNLKKSLDNDDDTTSDTSSIHSHSIHLATPVPSPTLAASDYMSGGEKIRKSYQVNQAMPMIYPITNNYNGDGVIPLAMREADEILRKSIYESYSIKRLWNERDYFMKQERGYADGYDKTTKNDDDDDDDNDEFDYNFNELRQKYPEKTSVIDTLERIETLYSQNLCRLNTIVEVFIETIKVNRLDYNLNFAELELNSKTKSGHRDETIQKKLKWY
ncbi:N1221-like family protein [Candida albicans]|uniref:N1221-like family protein n=1 Tax=Candida albicans TaxID=5476 RepID=A0A8H6BSH1_CANAX|nr:N1221-like family protein [Candida albicans]